MSDQPWASPATPAPEPEREPLAPRAPTAMQPAAATPSPAPATPHQAPVEPDATAAGASEGARGGVAEQIFAEVEDLTAGGAMSKSDAFARISERTGRRAGTVAANYYRIARKRGADLEPRTRRGPGRPAGSGRGPRATTPVGDSDAVIRRLEEAMADLAALVRAQDSEIARLREASEQFERLRDWMAKNA